MMCKLPRSDGRNSRFTIFTRCGICGKIVKKENHIGIRLNDDDWEDSMQYYHPECYGSKFSNIPRNRMLILNGVEVNE